MLFPQNHLFVIALLFFSFLLYTPPSPKGTLIHCPIRLACGYDFALFFLSLYGRMLNAFKCKRGSLGRYILIY